MTKHAIIPFIAAILLFSCTAMIPSEDEIMNLISAIPDHGIKKGSDKYFTEEYYSLLEQAWAIPSDAIGEIGSDEWLYYFITGNDTPDNPPSPKILDISEATNGVTVLFSFLEMEHNMNLVIKNGKWIIADYDNTLIKLKEYIERQREYFLSDDWKEYLDNTRKEYSAEEADLAEKNVKEYFSKYR